MNTIAPFPTLRRFRRPPALCLLASLIVISSTRAPADELPLFGPEAPTVGVHGFVSQGYLASSEYNYLGDSSQGSFKFTEAGLNASFDPFARTRISAQGFSYDVGPAGDYDVVLDEAQIEYTVNDLLGVRAGRIRRPEGIYNDIQDVDLGRTWVLLPQGMYNARWRDFYVTVDGGELFGDLPLAGAGSLSYQLYYGFQRPKLDGGLALQKANLPPYARLVSFNSPLLGGGQLWWNTPWDGLRAGLALNNDQDLTFVNVTGRQSVGSPWTQHYSLEYVHDDWTFQAEYLRFRVAYTNSGGGLPRSQVLVEPDTWYVSAARRLGSSFEVGTYYTEYYANVHDRTGATLAFPSDAAQKDTALSLRFDASDHWIFKLEGHFIRGTAQLLDNIDNPVRRGDAWRMIALKTTFCF